MKPFLGIAVAAAACAAFAGTPSVTVTDVSQDASRSLTVSYTLSGDPAVVTFSAQTNNGVEWVEIEDKSAFRYCYGDVNRRLEPAAHTLVWVADKAWPGHRITASGLRVNLKVWATNAPPDYLVADLFAHQSHRYYEYAASIPDGVGHDRYKESKMIFRKIPAAGVAWRMGKAGETADAKLRAHQVTLSEDYYMAIYPFTYGQYYYTSQVTPVNHNEHLAVSDLYVGGQYDNIKTAVNAVSAITGLEIGFPTEAQWEYACRAETGNSYYNGSDSMSGDSYGWVNKSGKNPVGLTIPNAWGLYDLYGNLWERCSDFYADYPEDPVTNPVGEGTTRIHRGGSYHSSWGQSSSWYRFNGVNYWGTGYRFIAPAKAMK